MVKGDTESFGFEVEGVDSLDAAFFSCKQNSQDTEYLFQKGLGYGITQDENNYFTVRIAPADTQNLEPGQYWYDLEIQKNGDVFTIFRGVLNILPQITRDVLPRSDATWGFITGDINNQSDLQLELDTKADTSSLSAVATSGSYTDLINTPNLATVATSGSYNDLTSKPNLASVAVTGSYNSLINKPSIPTKTSDLTNDSNFVVSTNLATVATSGSYTDLSNTPSLATVATSGLITDLTGVLPLTNGGTGATTAADARTNLSIKSEVIWENSEGAISFSIPSGSLQDAVRIGVLYKLVSTASETVYTDQINVAGFKYDFFTVADTDRAFQLDFIAFTNNSSNPKFWVSNNIIHVSKTFCYAEYAKTFKTTFDTRTSTTTVEKPPNANVRFNFYRIDKYTY
jgi:hypothetical protein